MSKTVIIFNNKKGTTPVEPKKKKVGDILKENGALINYFKDPYGFRAGVIVIMKGQGKCHPRIGYAFFDEVSDKEAVHTRMWEIPYYAQYLYDTTVDPSLPWGEYVTEVVVNEEDKVALVELAISRANYQSWDFYSSREVSLGQSSANLRESVLSKMTVTYKDEPQCAILRKAIREAEFRAYRYFK